MHGYDLTLLIINILLPLYRAGETFKLVALRATKPHNLVARRKILLAQNIQYKQIK